MNAQYEINLRQWRQELGFGESVHCSEVSGELPSFFRFCEQVQQKYPDSPYDPTTLFVWSHGEPPLRDMTALNCLPFRRKTDVWPSDSLGNPMTFVMQVRFTESQSYLPPLPGDLLLIFAKDDWGDELHFEWQSIGISECELAAAEDCYPPSWKFLKAFGRSFQLKRSYAGIDELYKKPSVLTSDLFIRRSRAPIEEGPARGVFYLYVNPVLFIDPDPKFPFLNMRTLPRERELDSEDFRFLLRQGMTLEVWMDIHRQISWRLWS